MGATVRRLAEACADFGSRAGWTVSAAAGRPVPYGVEVEVCREPIRRGTPIAEIFGPDSRAEVPFLAQARRKSEDVTLAGRFDRLVVTADRVLVVDYKTNRPAPSRIEDADPAYVLQLAVYRAVLARLYDDRPVEAALVWTDGPKLMPIPQAMLEAALADS